MESRIRARSNAKIRIFDLGEIIDTEPLLQELWKNLCVALLDVDATALLPEILGDARTHEIVVAVGIMAADSV